MKFWKSLKTKLGDCLWSLVASIVAKQTTKDNMFQARMAFDSLFKMCGQKMFEIMATTVTK